MLNSSLKDTATEAYSLRLKRLTSSWLHKLVPVQMPYQWNLRRWDLGFVLDVGCGIGRNLKNLKGNAVGVDPNPHSVQLARQTGFRAYTTEEFKQSSYASAGRFDSLLIAHVLEHVEPETQSTLLQTYLPYVRPGGRIVLITPQEAGFRSDTSHLQFTDAGHLSRMLLEHRCRLIRSYSFPFPRVCGHFFKHNEFVVVGEKPNH